MKNSIVGPLNGYNSPSCKGFGDIGTASSYAKEISERKRCIKFVIRTGDVFFVSDTGDVQRYEQLYFVFENGLIRENSKRGPVSLKDIGERTYNSKYKTIQ